MIQTALKLWKDSGRKDPALRDRLMQLYTRRDRATHERAQQKRAVGNPGPEGSIGKLANAELNQAISELCVDLMGPEGMLFETYEMNRERVMTARSVDPRASFLRSRANTIEGGTSEVMRNILGERVLGLPGDVRVDRGVPGKTSPATNGGVGRYLNSGRTYLPMSSIDCMTFSCGILSGFTRQSSRSQPTSSYFFADAMHWSGSPMTAEPESRR